MSLFIVAPSNIAQGLDLHMTGSNTICNGGPSVTRIEQSCLLKERGPHHIGSIISRLIVFTNYLLFNFFSIIESLFEIKKVLP